MAGSTAAATAALSSRQHLGPGSGGVAAAANQCQDQPSLSSSQPGPTGPQHPHKKRRDCSSSEERHSSSSNTARGSGISSNGSSSRSSSTRVNKDNDSRRSKGRQSDLIVEIPFWLHKDRPPKWVSGIGAGTTCREVLLSLAGASGGVFGDVDVLANRLALVEEWRGVVKPLNPASRIFKIWQAWGDERSHVRFIVKRITSAAAPSKPGPSPSSSGPPPSHPGTQSEEARLHRRSGRTRRSEGILPGDPETTVPPTSAAATSSTTRAAVPSGQARQLLQQHQQQLQPSRRRVRRRNSNASSVCSRHSMDEVHPKALLLMRSSDLGDHRRDWSSRKQRQDTEVLRPHHNGESRQAFDRHIEDMMRTIVAQGRMICEQLNRLNEVGPDQKQQQQQQQRPELAAAVGRLAGAFSHDLNNGCNDLVVQQQQQPPCPRSPSDSSSWGRRGPGEEDQVGCRSSSSDGRSSSRNSQQQQQQQQQVVVRAQVHADEKKSSSRSSSLSSSSKTSVQPPPNIPEDDLHIPSQSSQQQCQQQLQAQHQQSQQQQQHVKFQRDLLILRTIHGELHKLCQMNDKLTFAEDSVDRLTIAIQQQQEQQQQQQQKPQNACPGSWEPATEEGQQEQHLNSTRDQLARLREANDEATRQIERNRSDIVSLESRFKERREALKHLEYDVNVIEKEGRKLAKELDKVLKLQVDPLSLRMAAQVKENHYHLGGGGQQDDQDADADVDDDDDGDDEDEEVDEDDAEGDRHRPHLHHRHHHHDEEPVPLNSSSSSSTSSFDMVAGGPFLTYVVDDDDDDVVDLQRSSRGRPPLHSNSSIGSVAAGAAGSVFNDGRLTITGSPAGSGASSSGNSSSKSIQFSDGGASGGGGTDSVAPVFFPSSTPDLPDLNDDYYFGHEPSGARGSYCAAIKDGFLQEMPRLPPPQAAAVAPDMIGDLVPAAAALAKVKAKASGSGLTFVRRVGAAGVGGHPDAVAKEDHHLRHRHHHHHHLQHIHQHHHHRQSPENQVLDGQGNVNDIDTDNSDTGLSSLHSSSDEGTFDIGTLV